MLMLRFLLIVVTLAAITLGYGWWHASTHASFHADFRLLNKQLFDRSSASPGPVLPGAKVIFMDANGEVLATGINDEQHNYLHLIHPGEGDCHRMEKVATISSEGRSAWQDCYEALSTWTSTWITRVAQVAVRHGKCFYDVIPVDISEYYSDWYLWWLPLPHIGGTPYMHYRLSIPVDEKTCP